MVVEYRNSQKGLIAYPRLADNEDMVSPAQSQLIAASLMPAAVGNQISYAVAAKSLDAQKQAGAAVLQLLDGAANAAEPGNPEGLGTQLDVTG